ncbi:hypothetical protein Cpar_1598 [Chlorobaculum parvum NCIB 8327]|uniref:Uncharacterized protein n=1 Tax=Chlorobaculum parvum (strain DSM 263 / NCIMB 8327) TaxID=517417 RepID=B3QPZ3_CHLP8|nr:hypothetical protein Cpar_1598 [Chlorobaculum parvum NCIB 8327]
MTARICYIEHAISSTRCSFNILLKNSPDSQVSLWILSVVGNSSASLKFPEVYVRKQDIPLY